MPDTDRIDVPIVGAHGDPRHVSEARDPLRGVLKHLNQGEAPRVCVATVDGDSALFPRVVRAGHIDARVVRTDGNREGAVHAWNAAKHVDRLDKGEGTRVPVPAENRHRPVLAAGGIDVPAIRADGQAPGCVDAHDAIDAVQV